MTLVNNSTRDASKLVLAMMLIAHVEAVAAFIPPVFPGANHRQNSFLTTRVLSSADDMAIGQISKEEIDHERVAVRAPLKFAGPYPCLGLTFPHLATSSQRARNMSGISLDFVLDTGANLNTINAEVAKELDLTVIGQAPPGMAASGAMAGGSTFLLGQCQLEGIPQQDSFTFMQKLTASALPVASPASAGLLSLPFFHCFEGGVEFDWRVHGERQIPPSVTFYGPGESDAIRQAMTEVSIKEIPVTRLPTVQLTINNITITALLDTGSPITVINAQATKEAGVETIEIATWKSKQNGINPLANIINRVQEAQSVAQATARGDILIIAGSAGQPVQLFKSASKANIQLAGGAMEEEMVDFGSGNIYVGNFPGLAALNRFGDDCPPAAVLGMDVLMRRPNMLFIARDQKVYF